MNSWKSDHSPVLVERRSSSTRFDGWKSISQYLGRCTRTVQRWHADHNLPIRHLGGESGSVFAYSDELDSWLRSRGIPVVSRPLEARQPDIATAHHSHRGNAMHGANSQFTFSVGSATGSTEELMARAQKIWETLSQSSLAVLTKVYREVIDREVGNAEAFAGLACALIASGLLGNLRAPLAYSAAKEAAIRALDINPELPMARCAEAFLKVVSERDWQGGRIAFDGMLNERQRTAQALTGRALLYVAEGSPDLACSLLKEVIRKEALKATAVSLRIWTEYLAGRYELALAMASEARAKGHSGATLDGVEALALIQVEPFKVSTKRLKALTEWSPLHCALQGVLGYAYAKSGEPERARSILQMLARPEVKETHNHTYPSALIMIGLGERQVAVQWLEQSYREGSIWSLAFHCDPILEPLHNDLNYQLLMSRINYPLTRASVHSATAVTDRDMVHSA